MSTGVPIGGIVSDSGLGPAGGGGGLAFKRENWGVPGGVGKIPPKRLSLPLPIGYLVGQM